MFRNLCAYVLAAFVFGVADHVRTPHWMKLDADAAPVRSWWEWPNYEDYTIVSHAWGFTRMKGDRGASRHWFNRLDDMFRPSDPFFPETFDPIRDRVRHTGERDGVPKRFNSYCHIEKTEFTRRIANYLRDNNSSRLPIPSQDTISWYCSQIWNEPVKLVNIESGSRIELLST